MKNSSAEQGRPTPEAAKKKVLDSPKKPEHLQLLEELKKEMDTTEIHDLDDEDIIFDDDGAPKEVVIEMEAEPEDVFTFEIPENAPSHIVDEIKTITPVKKEEFVIKSPEEDLSSFPKSEYQQTVHTARKKFQHDSISYHLQLEEYLSNASKNEALWFEKGPEIYRAQAQLCKLSNELDAATSAARERFILKTKTSAIEREDQVFKEREQALRVAYQNSIEKDKAEFDKALKIPTWSDSLVGSVAKINARLSENYLSFIKQLKAINQEHIGTTNRLYQELRMSSFPALVFKIRQRFDQDAYHVTNRIDELRVKLGLTKSEPEKNALKKEIGLLYQSMLKLAEERDSNISQLKNEFETQLETELESHVEITADYTDEKEQEQATNETYDAKIAPLQKELDTLKILVKSKGDEVKKLYTSRIRDLEADIQTLNKKRTKTLNPPKIDLTSNKKLDTDSKDYF